ncbi:MBL fold metallo-hydrolase [Ottowia sp.]|jgi:phosphoribosyl 1,2-cyclic phosphodiesterase|uniref:MBL fold metallo-hydrolase n=1 Tax=Ottowia sp. TaxID=1898956 RepID=UPI0025E65305|nr:MBL fold metallo-hydrolase [Ottowia sp.]MBK6612930.1 MBL fold metallo-hydrolase [Ottowia sp.]
MLRLRSLASGSAGNATLVEATDGTQRTRVLIDCGLGWRQLAASLAGAGLSVDELDAIFITHEHGDHVGCAPLVAARHGVPLWASAGTRQALRQAGCELPIALTADGETVAIGALQIRPFTVPHDAREPLQLTCTDGDRTLGVLTDLGHVTPHVLGRLAGCHALMLESNHDPDMLARSRYPDFLKRRVGGPHGHLSNAQAARALRALRHDRLGTVVAAHLSERNNLPQLVRDAFADALGCASGDVLVTSRHGLDWLRA